MKLSIIKCIFPLFVCLCCGFQWWFLYKSETDSVFIREFKALQETIRDLKNQNQGHQQEIRNLLDKLSNAVSNKDEFLKLESVNQQLLAELKNQTIALQKSRDEIHKSSVTCVEKEKYNVKEETLKRRVRNDLQELIYSIQSKIKQLPLTNQTAINQREDILKSINFQQTAALIDADELVEINEKWKKEESKALQELVQNRIRYAQNPTDCKNKRKLIYNINRPCGFGCQLHYVNYCFMIAFGTNRTLVLNSKGWSYNPNGWNEVFQPLSNTCTGQSTVLPKTWGVGTENEQEVVIYATEGLNPLPPFIPLNIPEDIAPRLKRLHGNPAVWWIGQFMNYLFRSQPWLTQEMQSYEQKINFDKPIVGIHVRRTDKIGTEASFHSVEEYMIHVEAWYDKYDIIHRKEGEKVHRRVYIATDEPNVLSEAKQGYPNYEFVTMESFAKSASNLHQRYTRESLLGVIHDVHLLSLCNYIVCTFSSQICRSAYDLMQTLHPDASSYAHSLDDIYYYTGQTGHYQRAIYDHQPDKSNNEIELKINDVIKTLGNHWDGFSKALNTRTNKIGLYPSWKVEEIIEEAKYPTYPKSNTPSG